MSILINLNASRLQQQFGDAAVDAVAREKVRQLLRVSRYNFRDDTGALRRTIRQERGGIVAIGDRAHTYWQHVLRFRRGDGTIWVRQVLLRDNYQALQKARGAAR